MRLLDPGLHRDAGEQRLLVQFLQVLEAGAQGRFDAQLRVQGLALEQIAVGRRRPRTGLGLEACLEGQPPFDERVAQGLVELRHGLEPGAVDVGRGGNAEGFEQRHLAVLLDDAAGPSGTVNAQTKIRKFLGSVNVAIGQAVGLDPKAFLQNELIAAAGRTMPLAVRQKVQDDLRNDLRLTLFVPHRDVAAAEVTGKQSAELRIDLSAGAKFEVDKKPYDPTKFPRTLMLGKVEEWTLTGGTDPQVVRGMAANASLFQLLSDRPPETPLEPFDPRRFG